MSSKSSSRLKREASIGEAVPRLDVIGSLFGPNIGSEESENGANSCPKMSLKESTSQIWRRLTSGFA